MVQAELALRQGRCSRTTRSTALRSKGSPRDGKAIRLEVFGLSVEAIEPKDKELALLVGVVPRDLGHPGGRLDMATDVLPPSENAIDVDDRVAAGMPNSHRLPNLGLRCRLESECAGRES